MNDMRKLMETASQLDESVYFEPIVKKELDMVVRQLLSVVEKHGLDEDDVAAYVEQKLYPVGDEGFNMRGI